MCQRIELDALVRSVLPPAICLPISTRNSFCPKKKRHKREWTVPLVLSTLVRNEKPETASRRWEAYMTKCTQRLLCFYYAFMLLSAAVRIENNFFRRRCRSVKFFNLISGFIYRKSAMLARKKKLNYTACKWHNGEFYYTCRSQSDVDVCSSCSMVWSGARAATGEEGSGCSSLFFVLNDSEQEPEFRALHHDKSPRLLSLSSAAQKKQENLT